MAIFNEQDFEELQNKQLTIHMQDTITITATTVSPLLQMDENGEQRKRYTYIEGLPYQEPFYSANGLRGLLRRVMTKDMIHFIKEKEPNFKIKADELYLYASGASTAKKSIENISWEEKIKLRAKSPILSLFGAGLSGIEGKTAVCDLVPISKMKKIRILKDSDNVEYKKIMPLTQKQTYFRTDDNIKKNMLTELVDQEDVSLWKENYNKLVTMSKELKKSGEKKKEENSHIAQIISLESILPNITLSSSINPLYGHNFTDIEIGLLLKALIEVSNMQLGASKRLGFGVLEWNIEFKSQTMFSTIVDKDYIFNREVIISKKCKEFINTYNKWAKTNYSSKIDIKSLLV